MRRYFAKLLLTIVAVVELLAVPWVSADSMAQYKVTAAVASTREIILASDGQIERIISNTSQNVTPTVYALTLKAANERPLGIQTLAEYNAIILKIKHPEAGVIYKRVVPPTKINQNDWNNLVSVILYRH